jgi:hypothetical protein
MNQSIRNLLVGLIVLLLPFVTIGSPQKGGGNHSSRGGAQTSVNRGSNTNVNTNKNVNVNSNKNVNVNVDNNRNGYYGGGYNNGCCYHQSVGGAVATAAAVTATTMVTAAVVGSMINTLPPSCSTVIVNGMSYSQCGSTWYQPQFSGSNTTYVVVNAPR